MTQGVGMINKQSDFISALFPLCLIVIAGAVGLKSNFDLFSLNNVSQAAEAPVGVITLHNLEDDL